MRIKPKYWWMAVAPWDKSIDFDGLTRKKATARSWALGQARDCWINFATPAEQRSIPRPRSYAEAEALGFYAVRVKVEVVG